MPHRVAAASRRTRPNRLPIALVIVLGTVAAPAAAHEIVHAVAAGPAIVVTLSEDDGSPLAAESYEIFGPGADTPFQSGRTDSLGRAVFVPDRRGSWRIRVWTEDGHGGVFDIETDAAGTPVAAGRSAGARTVRLLAGVCVLLGIFGVLALWTRRREG